MNEQITNILNQSITKTSKIQQLLLLGLTRRQVADLVTNGNYGFVQNVYKKMLEAGTFAPVANTTTFLPEIDYTFNRRFGIEIEAYNCTRDHLAHELQEAGINVAVEGYNHNTSAHWKLVTDASLYGNKKVCWVLDLCNAKVNESCGLHVHMDAADFTMNTWKNLALSYKNIENTINAFMPATRRDNQYCKSLSRISERRILQANTLDDLRAAFGNDRYHKVNLEAYARHRTIEFRQHSGSTNFTKMSNWVLFLGRMITFAQQAKVETGTTLQNLPFLTDDQKIYFKLRTKKLSR